MELTVPSLADPRHELILGCRFDMGGEELNSVKWYKDEQEFFRYTPLRQPHVMSFPVAGVHLVGDSAYDTRDSQCGVDRCIVKLERLTTAHSGGSYRCEVSTEAPAFRVAFDTANVTVAAVGREDPRVQGVLPVYAPGDLVNGNCTSAPADPAPVLGWLINGQPAPPMALGPLRTSLPDSLGMVTRSITLRFHVERRHFREPAGTLELQCVVRMPGVPAPARTTALTATLRDTYQRNVLGNQKLSWPSSTGNF